MQQQQELRRQCDEEVGVLKQDLERVMEEEGRLKAECAELYVQVSGERKACAQLGEELASARAELQTSQAELQTARAELDRHRGEVKQLRKTSDELKKQCEDNYVFKRERDLITLKEENKTLREEVEKMGRECEEGKVQITRQIEHNVQARYKQQIAELQKTIQSQEDLIWQEPGDESDAETTDEDE